ncbi:MAG: PQQ-binding-like beta-propeller repeat protein [Gemmatimonadota bacterium]
MTEPLEAPRRQPRRPLLLVLAVGIVAQFVWCEADALRHNPYSVWSPSRVEAAMLVLCIYGAAFALLDAHIWKRLRSVRWLIVAAALVFAARFHVVRALMAKNAETSALTEALPSTQAALLTAFLRELSAAQEQYRLRQHTYAASLDSLLDWMTFPAERVTVSLSRHGDLGWSGRASVDTTHCSIWVRDSTLRNESAELEGAPYCGKTLRAKQRMVRTVTAQLDAPERGFRPEDIRDTWLQHRADRSRSGIGSTAAGPYRWTTRVAGELLGSVAVAGNQLFVGAHGNGEFVALTLDSGRVGYRLRTPNWIHHEPVVTSDAVIVGFGNNEMRPTENQFLGSDPSGIVAYDRRTGVERWHRYTRASMMTSPVVRDSIVASISASQEATGWRISDGKELWRTMLPASGPMANPLLIDTLMVVGLEKSVICVLDVRTGVSVYCHRAASGVWGAGHASTAVAGTTLLHAFDQGVSLGSLLRARRFGFAAAKMLRLPGWSYTLSEQVLVGFELATGRELWRVRLGIGQYERNGHVAGTPTVADGVVYVPSPISGRVTAVRPDSGRVIWSTDVRTARGSVVVTRGAVLVSTLDTALVVLDASTGRVRCRQHLPGLSDRAGPTLAGETGIMTFRNGIVAARPVADWLSCRV